ncbi:hypothetical protein M758_3G048500 [Ceratodon purpureus]|uniref:DUF3172 domain-containing protein n=1 Tax=Ceratodon purpureus TaxID=3225 RepID=A0A8T0IHA5_CERPU|nr:hypothetical protein KC19_3G049200 [Ceratodon purpureus]KAG0621788.1 hypothetical protein M758_3G048500 [Ceratodon purpureus]
MSGSSGLLCRVPASNVRCGFCFAELADWRSRGWEGGEFVSFNSHRFLGDRRKLLVGRLIGKSKPGGGVGGARIRALQTDEERRRFRSQSGNYPPRSPPGSLNPDLEEENELPLLRGTSRRDPNMEADVGYPPSRDGFSGRRVEDYEEEDDRPQPWLAIWRGVNRYILAGIFVLGMGAGITVDTVLNVEPNNVASREVIDRQTPNPDVCIANGMSAMVLDQRLFISFNPFNVYVSQTEVKPGCVLRQSNWNVLEGRGLVSSDEVRACKRNMNTFGFVGDLRQAPEISCVYHSESAENQFLKDPSKATLGDGFQPKDIEE